ncbi:MAG: acetyl-CoA C-acyltransferase FadA [Endozoicomonadaceae bacterium]|nr:acetyl-CoA C-acyltransferase FadA [Endozoicomonadaceae bacterium]
MKRDYNPTDAVIIDTVRTPMGRSREGLFRYIRAEQLSAHVMNSLVKRQPNWDIELTDDIIWGCVKQTKEQGLNIARNAALLAGLPYSIPAQTVNRLCGSSMQAVHDATLAIRAGVGHIYIAGGVEHMGHIPMDYEVDINPAASLFSAKASNLMGLTAEMLAKFHSVTRDAQDQFALRSHQLAAQATHQGYWKSEIVATEGHNVQGFKVACDRDEVIRFDSSLDALSALKPSFDPKKGSVTAGSSSALSDGAAGLLVMSYEKANILGLIPRAKIKAIAVSGCDPALMGRGPVPATQKILKQANITLQDIDTFELNEAFAAQALSVIQELKLESMLDHKINLQGGSIALGHPLGCSGARIIGTLLNIMERKDTTLGLATMCIGLGQGIATLIERC